jgi:hypothetical protein
MLNPENLKQMLTKEQRAAGITIEDDEDFVTLKCGETLIGHYSAVGVTPWDIQQDVTEYLETRKAVTIQDMDDTVKQIKALVETLKR